MAEQTSMFTAGLESMDKTEPWYPLACAALKTVRNQWSTNTKMAYANGIRCWHDWCRIRSESQHLPPRVESVVMWLQWQVDELHYAPRTIQLYLCGLAWADQWARLTPCSPHTTHSLLHHPLIRAWRRGHMRIAEHPRAIQPASRDELYALVAGCMVLRRRQGPTRTPFLMSRDRALVLLLFYGAMRKSELVALRTEDISVTDRGLEIEFRRSKTDQNGKGEVRAILPQTDLLMCPVDAWKRWREHYPDDGPAFITSRLPHKAIAYQSIDNLIAGRCKEAGIRPLSPHSLRAAFATHALERHDEGEVAYHGRWASRSTMDTYVRRGKTWRKNPTSGLSDK